jgi:hypothetical protein
MTDEELEGEYNAVKDSLQHCIDNLMDWRKFYGPYPKIDADIDAAIKLLESAVERMD